MKVLANFISTNVQNLTGADELKRELEAEQKLLEQEKRLKDG